MNPIQVGYYEHPEADDGWSGWVEPRNLSWILFFKEGGEIKLYTKRDPITGAVLEDDDNYNLLSTSSYEDDGDDI